MNNLLLYCGLKQNKCFLKKITCKFEVYIILNNLLHVQKCVCVPYFICTFLQQIAITGNQVHTNTLDQKGLEQARLQTKGQIQCSIVVRQKQQICIQICINSLMAEKKNKTENVHDIAQQFKRGHIGAKMMILQVNNFHTISFFIFSLKI